MPAPTRRRRVIDKLSRHGKLIFSEDFAGSNLDTTKWATKLPWASTLYYNNNIQYWQSDDVIVSNGVVTLRGQKRDISGVDVNGNPTTYHYSGGMITTAGDNVGDTARFAFQYGYMEARIKHTKNPGMHCTWWMLPARDYWIPELDMSEYGFGQSDQLYTAVGYIAGQTNPPTTLYTQDNTAVELFDVQGNPGFDVSQWHTYGCDWQPDKIVFYVDGIEKYRITNPAHIPQWPMYFMATVEMLGGGYWGAIVDANLPDTGFQIDYIRVWSNNPDAIVPAPTVSSISPTSGSSGTALTINGTGFGNYPLVKIGGVAATSVTRVSPTQISCNAPSLAIGTYDVIVQNEDSKKATLTNGYTVTPNYLVYATFTGVDGTDLTTVAPDIGPTPSKIGNVVWTIQSNQAFGSSGADDEHHLYWDVGTGNVTFETTFTNVVENQGISLRLNTRVNYILFVAEATRYAVYEVVDGNTYNEKGSYNATPTNGDVVKAVLSGSSCRYYINGTQQISYTSTFNQSITKQGLRTTGTNGPARWDNVKIY